MHDPETPVVLTHEQLTRVAEDAAAAGMRQLLRRRDWRVGLIAFVAGVVATAAVSIPTTYFVSHDAANKAVASGKLNAKHNCRNVTKLAQVEEQTYREQQAETRLFTREQKGHFGLTPKQFNDLLAQAERREQIRLASLEAIASTDCNGTVSSTPIPVVPTTTHPSRGK